MIRPEMNMTLEREAVRTGGASLNRRRWSYIPEDVRPSERKKRSVRLSCS